MYKGFKMPMAVNLSLLSGPVVVFDANNFFLDLRVSSSTRVDILWDGTCVSLSFDNFRL